MLIIGESSPGKTLWLIANRISTNSLRFHPHDAGRLFFPGAEVRSAGGPFGELEPHEPAKTFVYADEVRASIDG